MEREFLKMFAQVSFLVVVVWVVASFIVRKDLEKEEAQKKQGKRARRSKGDRWADGCCIGERAEQDRFEPVQVMAPYQA